MVGHPLGIQPWGNCLLNHGRDARSEGLGLLKSLSDELLLEILSELPATAISRLSCCSKALYCFCSHEDLWKAFALEAGGFTWHGSWKHAFIAQQSSKGTVPHPASLTVRGFYSDLLYQPWYCATVDISEEWLEVDNIDRRPGITAEEFQQQYEAPNRPVLVPGGVADWPALNKWTHQYLSDAFHGKDVIVGNMPMSWGEYLKYSGGNQDEMPLYLFDKDFTETAPHLAQDYWIPDFLKEDLFSVMGSERPDYRWLIMGPPRSGSSFHIDPNATSAWNAVVTGSKKWILYPPQHIPPGVHPSDDGADVATPISILEWFLNYYSATKEGPKPVECIARAGDVIFVPSGWWHLALNLEESVAVTQNFVSSATLGKVLRFLESKRSDLVSGCAMHDRATLYDRFVSGLQEQQPAAWARYQAAQAARLAHRQEAHRLSSLFRVDATDASEHAVASHGHSGQAPYHAPRAEAKAAAASAHRARSDTAGSDTAVPQSSTERRNGCCEDVQLSQPQKSAGFSFNFSFS